MTSCARIPHRALLSVTGVHAHQFLHGLLAQGPPTPTQGGFFTTFLHAQGRVLYDAFVYRNPAEDETYLIEYDSRPSEAPPLLSLLKRYVLRSRVKVKDVSDEWDIWAAWNSGDRPDDRKWRWSRSGAAEPVWENQDWPWGGVTDPLLLQDRRAHGMGTRRLVRKGDPYPHASGHNVTSPEEYLRHRILHGVPEGIDDIPPMHAFPMESNLDIMGAIDFRKGCYVGQELTVRTYHTGVVRKRIFPVKLQPLDGRGKLSSLKVGLDIRPVAHAVSEGRPSRQRGTGKLLSSIGNIGLALLRLEHVETVNRGIATLELETGEDDAEKCKYHVERLTPSGWPVRGVNEIDE